MKRAGKTKRDRRCRKILMGFDRADRLPSDAGHIGQRTLREAFRQPQATETVLYIAGWFCFVVLAHQVVMNSNDTLLLSIASKRDYLLVDN
jgi:hypothetical protein